MAKTKKVVETLSFSNNPAVVDILESKKAAKVYRALNHTLRQQMLKVIDAKKKVTVTELHTKLKLEQSVASQHLAILRNANLVTTVRNGKFIFYSVNYPQFSEVNKASLILLNYKKA